MPHQLELACLGIEVPDPTSLTPFFAEVVGLVPGATGPAGTVTWRNDDRRRQQADKPTVTGGTFRDSPLATWTVK